MTETVVVVSQGWNLNSPELKNLLGLKDARAIIKELRRIKCPIRKGKYVIAEEFFQKLKEDESAISYIEPKSESARKLKA